MAKASVSGHVKTRMVPPLTFDEAAAFNTAFLKDVAANVLAAAERDDIAGYMAFGPPGPDSSAFFEQILPSDIGLLEAWHPTLGECLHSTIEQLLARGHGSAVVLNSDSPTMPTSFLVETARLLARPGDHAVVGPSTDGGYNLLGLKRAHRRLFEDIAWSTAQVGRQTLERAAEIGLSVHLLPAWYDVDDGASLRTLYAELCEHAAFSVSLHPHQAAHSARLLRSLVADAGLAGRLAADVSDPAARAAE